MPSPLQEAAVQSIELDAFAKDIPDLIPLFDTLYSFAKKNFKTVPASNITEGGGTTRPSARVPFRVQAGAPISQGTGDADGLGRGSGSLWRSFALSPIVIKAANEITWLSKKATDGRERGLFNVSAQELKNTLASCTRGIEGLMNGDGSGSIDQIPPTATINNNTGTGNTTSQLIGMNNVAGFTDQQIVQFFPAIGGVARGSAVISIVDAVTNTLSFITPLPTGVAAGDYVMVSGGAATGAAGSSLLGLRYWQNNGNTGTIAGVNRANFPGRLSTPTIDLAGGPMTQSIGLRAATLMGRALGPDADSIDDAIWYTGPDQGISISNLMFNVQIVNAQEVEGNKPIDMGKKFFPDTWCNRNLMVSWTALPGRADLITPDTWYIFETAPLELYDFGGGSTVMPVPDIAGAGSYLTSYIMAYITAFNVCNSNMLAGAYIQNASIPQIN